MIPKKPEEWLSHVNLAVRYREAHNRKKRWDENYDWFMGKYPAGIIPVNLVFGISRGMIPQIYFKSPTICIRPRPGNPQQYAARMQQAKILEAVDAQLVLHMGLKRTLKLVALDSLIYNVGIMKVGYHSQDSEFGEVPEPVDRGFVEAMGELLGEPLGESGETPEERKMRMRYSYHDLVKPDSPWVLRVSPHDFIIPLGVKCIEEAPWCGFRFVRRLDEVKASPVYRNTSKLQSNTNIEVSGSGVDSPKTYQQQPIGSDDEYVELWEIWDKRTGRITVVAEGHDKFLRNEEHGLPLNCLPVTLLQFNSTGEDFWGISHMDAINPQVMEYNETRTHEMAHRKGASTRIIAERAAFKPEEVERIQRGDVYGIAFSESPPGNSVMQFTPTMSRDIYQIADDIFNDIQTVIGFNRNQGGDFESSRRTATEVKNVAQHNYLRDDELRDITADAIVDLFQNKIHPIIFEMWRGAQRAVEITSMPIDGIPWVNYTGDDIRGDYDVYVVPDSTMPLSKEQEKQEAVTVFQLLRNDPRVRQGPLYQQTLEKFPQLKVEELLKTDQELAQEMQQQFQMQLILNQSKTQPTGGQEQSQRPKAVEGGKGRA